MIPTKIWARSALVLALVACKDKEPEMPNVSQVFPKLPLPPRRAWSRGAAAPTRCRSRSCRPAKAKDVEAYYRAMLSKNGWRLVNDMRDKDGSVVLLAEQDGPPLWVRIKSTDDSVATLVELAGAVVARRRQARASPPPEPRSGRRVEHVLEPQPPRVEVEIHEPGRPVPVLRHDQLGGALHALARADTSPPDRSPAPDPRSA